MMGRWLCELCQLGQWSFQALCSVTDVTMEPLSAANTRFALDLFLALDKDNPTGNIFVSPYSISSAMAMILLGARGDTEAQLSKVSRRLVFPRPPCCQHGQAYGTVPDPVWGTLSARALE